MLIGNKGKKISLDELPCYFDFIENAIAGSILNKTKSMHEVIREFDTDKWGKLLEYFSDNYGKTTVEEADSFLRKYKSNIFPIWCGDSFVLEDKEGASEKLHQLYYKVLLRYAEHVHSCSLVELGAGYGSNLFKLAKKVPFDKYNLSAGELTENGVKLLEIISKKMGLKGSFGMCDIYEGTMNGFEVEPGSLIYTSYAMCYKKNMDSKFVEFISSLNPEYVIHFEPVYEHMSQNSLYGLLCKKYIEFNGYTQNFLSVLKDCERKGIIDIYEEKKILFGINPLLPMSTIVWRPK